MEQAAMRRELPVLLAGLLAGGAAEAATQVQTVTVSSKNVVAVPLFDPKLGKLLSVSATASYDSVQAVKSPIAPVGFDQPVTGYATLGNLSFVLKGASSVAAQPGYWNFTVGATGAASWSDPAILAGFTGTSTLSATTWANAVAPGSLLGTAGPSVKYTLTYTYDDAPAVPEPATWALMGGGFLLTGLALRHARRTRAGIAAEM